MPLDTHLKETLVRQAADEMYQGFLSEPRFKEMVSAFIDHLDSSAVEFLERSGDVESDEKERMLAEYRTDVLSPLRAQFDSPERLKEIAAENARSLYTHSDELRGERDIQFEEMRGNDSEVNAKTMCDFYEASEKLLTYAAENDRILERLSEVAEAEGIGKAVQRETRYAIIREIFPTPESYGEYSANVLKAAKDLVQKTSDVLRVNDDSEQFPDVMECSFLADAMKKMMEFGERFAADYFDRRVQEIYG